MNHRPARAVLIVEDESIIAHDIRQILVDLGYDACGVAAVLRPTNPSITKRLTYECGVDPVGSGWSQSYVRYYVFGLLFVIFDVEAVFIFPWAVVVDQLGTFGIVEMFIFIVILLLGLLYAVRKGLIGELAIVALKRT